MRIRSIMIAGVSSLALAVGGCSTLSQIGTDLNPTSISTSSGAFVQDVTTITSQACKFIPTAETVAGLATQSNVTASAALTLASTIANVICAAVQPKASVALKRATVGAPPPAAPLVNGVPIHGQFTATGAII